MIEIIKHGNSGINVFSYNGQKALQVVGVEEAFNELSRRQTKPFARIIEIGTDYGGLTNLLASLEISKNINIYTFDVSNSRFISHDNKIIFYHKDVFSIETEIGKMIASEGRTLLLCDGGDKKKEFEIFHRYLKTGDIIMAHDYASTPEDFKENYFGKIWNWHEFQDSFADFNGLEPYMQDLFKKYAWCIRIKK